MKFIMMDFWTNVGKKCGSRQAAGLPGITKINTNTLLTMIFQEDQIINRWNDQKTEKYSGKPNAKTHS